MQRRVHIPVRIEGIYAEFGMYCIGMCWALIREMECHAEVPLLRHCASKEGCCGLVSLSIKYNKTCCRETSANACCLTLHTNIVRAFCQTDCDSC
jgi:hypothetical protein